jgi:hypothetical protein
MPRGYPIGWSANTTLMVRARTGRPWSLWSGRVLRVDGRTKRINEQVRLRQGSRISRCGATAPVRSGG